jgi:hypothetical protein
MKKGIFWALTVIFLFTLTSLAFSEEEALTPEKVSGLWKGYWNSVKMAQAKFGSTTMVAPYECRILITPSLNGIVNCRHAMATPWQLVLDGQGEIVGNQLVIRDRKDPSMIRMKAHITRKNRLEGECTEVYNGDLIRLEKIRDLKDEEKQQSLSQLEGLVKW